MARPINPKSLRQLAIKTAYIERRWIRLKRGADKIDALYLKINALK